MQNKSMRVIIKEPYKEPIVTNIVDTLENLQKIIGGLIEVISLPKSNGIDIIANEEGKMNSLEGNFFIPEYDDCIVGPAIIVSFNKGGEFVGLTNKQIEKALDYINNYKIEKEYDLYEDFELLNSVMKRKMQSLDKDDNLC